MRATLGRAEDYRGTIARLRTKLSRQIGFANSCTDPAPLPYAFYLFAWDACDAEPGAMAELFFYDQAFDSYAACAYAEAFDLEHLAPMDRVIHLRSLVADDGENRAASLRCLGQAVAQLAQCLGARYMTANPQLLEADFLSEHQPQGSPRPINCRTPSSEQVLSLIDLKPPVDRRENDASAALSTMDPLLLQTIRLRGQRALKVKTNPALRLDTLLPAHWVGVWQRQLRAYAI